MSRTVLIVLLSLGTVGGYAAGCASLHGRHGHHGLAGPHAFERHVAQVCVQAARDTHAGRAAQDAPAAMQPPAVVVVPVQGQSPPQPALPTVVQVVPMAPAAVAPAAASAPTGAP